MKNILLIHSNSGHPGFGRDTDRMFNYYNEEAKQILAPNKVIFPRPYEESIRKAISEFGVPDVALIEAFFPGSYNDPPRSFNLAMESCRLGVPLVGIYHGGGRIFHSTGEDPIRYKQSRIHIFDNLGTDRNEESYDLILEHLVKLDNRYLKECKSSEERKWTKTK